MCICPPMLMGITVWDSGTHHIRQRRPVSVRIMVLSRSPSRDPTPLHHSLPSLSQWNDWTLAYNVKDSTDGTMHQHRLDVPLIMGFVGNTHNDKGRTTCISSRDGKRSTIGGHGNYSQVHSIITQLKVPKYKLPGGQHSSLHHADQHATITGSHTPLKDCLRHIT